MQPCSTRRGSTRRCLIVAVFFLLTVSNAQATDPAAIAQTSAVAPTTAEVLFYTRPLVKARLRMPESLQQFSVVTVQPTPDDAFRFAVMVRFRAKTPFGALTEHEARFHMKRTASQKLWIVTAE